MTSEDQASNLFILSNRYFYFFLLVLFYINTVILYRKNFKGVSRYIQQRRVNVLGLTMYTLYMITGIKVKREKYMKIM